MKKVLITGANSYIGTSFVKWMCKWENLYSVKTIDLLDDLWKEEDFSKYDVIYHVAGIAHIKETKENSELYYKVNRDLVYEVAKKAKSEGVQQFIFLSSMSVYGLNKGRIDINSPVEPRNSYGDSKLQAEKLLDSIADINFRIAVLRPPMVYGKGCKGNYVTLEKFALKIPCFPDLWNERSMIYIDNLSEFVRMLIDNCSSGLFFPQNYEYVCTANMVKTIALAHGKKIWMTKIFNIFLKVIDISTITKVFGDLVYEKSTLENIDYNKYHFIDFEESIKLTEE